MTTLTDFRFPRSKLSSKPGPGGRTLVFVDIRHIQAALDELAPGWHSQIELTHNGSEYAAVCKLEIDEVVRSDVGSGDTPPDASNQAFRRCAAAHGLGRYLWLDGQGALRRSAPSNQQNHSNGAETPPTDAQGQPDSPFDDPDAGATVDKRPRLKKSAHALGRKLYAGNWDDVRHRNIHRLTKGRTDSINGLSAAELQTLIRGMRQVEAERAMVQQNGVAA